MTDQSTPRGDLDVEPVPRDGTAAGATVEPAAGPDLEAAPDTTPAQKRRGIDRGLVVASLVIAAGLVLIVWGMLGAVTGDDGIDRPDAIESLTPVENAIQVLQQESVIVDLQFGYEGRLTIDGIELPTTTIGEIEVEPGQQLELPPTAIFDPGSSIISFRPADGAVIESFEPGLHRVRLVYWPIEEGPEAASSYTWTFTAV